MNGYLLIRRSRVAFGMFHVLYGRLDTATGQIRVISYKPNRDEKRDIEIIFRGHVARGDSPLAASNELSNEKVNESGSR